jgi:cell wall-associated NlpC family hydrolase
MKNHGNRLREAIGALFFCLGLVPVCFEAVAADNAELISVSVPTNTPVAPGSMFTQSWILQNTGTTTWSPGPSGYTLNMVGLDSLGALPLFTNSGGTQRPSAIIGSGKSVAPGAQATFSIMFIAPERSGSYTDTFQMNGTNNFGPLVTVQVNVTQTGPTNVYDRARAISYANNYAGYVVRDGYFWTDGSDYAFYGTNFAPVPTNLLGDDCAHFVSSCIGQQPQLWGGGIPIPTRVPPTYGEPGAARLVNTCLIAPGYATEVSSLSEMAPGDVIGWNWEGDTNINDLDHVTLYLGNGLVASHAISALDVSATTYFQDGTPDWVWHLIHIIYGPTMLITPQMSPHGIFSFTVSGNAGAIYGIQTSTDLSVWNSMLTVSNATGSFQIIVDNSSASAPAYFYRAVMLPP